MSDNTTPQQRPVDMSHECTGEELHRWIEATIDLAEHGRQYHNQPGSIMTLAVEILSSFSKGDMEFIGLVSRTLAHVIQKRSYDVDAEMALDRELERQRALEALGKMGIDPENVETHGFGPNGYTVVPMTLDQFLHLIDRMEDGNNK